MPASAGEAAILLSVAQTELKQGSAEALEASKKALQAFKDVKDGDGVSEATALCVSACLLVGDISEASKMATDLQKTSSKPGAAKVALAEVLLAEGKGIDALAAAQEAKTAYDAAGDKKGSVDAFLAVSKARLAMGDKSDALEATQSALALANSLGEEDSEAAAWLGLMTVRFAFGQSQDGISAAYAAMGIYSESGDELGEAVVLKVLADTMLKEGMSGEALSVAMQASEKFKELGCPAAEAATLQIVVSSMLAAKQVEEAVAIAKKGAASLRGSGQPEVLGMMSLVSACIASKSEEGVHVGKDALAICKSGKMEKLEAKVCLLLCEACAATSQWDSAKEYGETALTMFKGFGDSASEAAAAKTLEAVAKGLEQAPALAMEKDMMARTQRENELELVKQAAKLIEDGDMQEFSILYKKLEVMEYVTPEEVAKYIEPVMESNDLWDATASKLQAAVEASRGTVGEYKIEAIHRRVAYMMNRLTGMGYGPKLRCCGDSHRHIPEMEVAMGQIKLYEQFKDDDWEGVAHYHPNILDATLQIQTGFGVPSAWKYGLATGI